MAVIIRAATLDDAPAVIEMGEEFHAAAGWADVVSFDAESFGQSVRNMIESDSFRVLVADKDGTAVGMAAAGFFPFYFNHDHLTGTEIFMWMQPDHRGQGVALLDAIETEARAAGCQSFTMGAMNRLNPEAVGRLYSRRGYRPNEHTWIKEL